MAAFDVLYERYEARLFAYLRAVTSDRRDAEEILHDAFLATLKSGAPTFEAGGFRAWLYRVARNQAFNKRRATKRHDRAIAAVPEPHDGDRRERADAAMEEREVEAALEDAVRKLPPLLGEIYHLRTSGLSYEQIASVVEVPLGTVKSRMHQMVHVLREELKPWIAPE